MLDQGDPIKRRILYHKPKIYDNDLLKTFRFLENGHVNFSDVN